MHHNYQIELHGSCSCYCHTHATAPCKCGLSKRGRALLGAKAKPPRKMRDSKIASQVKPFQRRHIAQRGAYNSRPYRLPYTRELVHG